MLNQDMVIVDCFAPYYFNVLWDYVQCVQLVHLWHAQLTSGPTFMTLYLQPRRYREAGQSSLWRWPSNRKMTEYGWRSPAVWGPLAVEVSLPGSY